MRADITICCIDLAATPALDASALATLSDTERARFDGYASRDAAHTFATTRLALRHLLSRRVGVPPSGIALSIEPDGKPACTQLAHGSFSVSHAGGWAAIASSDRLEIGIDLEPWTAFEASSALWPLACSAGEIDWLRRHPAQAAREFARLWVRKEALAKALGKGLRASLPALDLASSIQAVQGQASIACAPQGIERLAWHTLDRLPGFAAAIAAVADEPLRWELARFDAPARWA